MKPASGYLPSQAKEEVQICARAYAKADSTFVRVMAHLFTSIIAEKLIIPVGLICLLLATFQQVSWWALASTVALGGGNHLVQRILVRRLARSAKARQLSKEALLGMRLWPFPRRGSIRLRPYPQGKIGPKLDPRADLSVLTDDINAILRLHESAIELGFRTGRTAAAASMIALVASIIAVILGVEHFAGSGNFGAAFYITAAIAVVAAVRWVRTRPTIVVAKYALDEAEDRFISAGYWPEHEEGSLTLQHVPAGGLGPSLDPFKDASYKYDRRLGPRPAHAKPQTAA